MTVARAPITLEVCGPGGSQLDAVVYRIDGGAWEPLEGVGHRWRTEVAMGRLSDGSHTMEVLVVDPTGRKQAIDASFRVR